MALTNRSEINAQIEATLLKIERSVRDFDRKDRKTVLRAGANVVRKSARSRIPPGKRTTLIYKRRGVKRKMSPRTNKLSNNKEVKNVGARGGRVSSSYVRGNLNRSVRVLTFRGSPDLFVGPKFRSGGLNKGTSTTNADGFYADWAYGGTGRFRKRVLIPAARASRTAAVAAVRKKAIERFRGRAKARGLNVG